MCFVFCCILVRSRRYLALAMLEMCFSIPGLAMSIFILLLQAVEAPANLRDPVQTVAHRVLGLVRRGPGGAMSLTR